MRVAYEANAERHMSASAAAAFTYRIRVDLQLADGEDAAHVLLYTSPQPPVQSVRESRRRLYPSHDKELITRIDYDVRAGGTQEAVAIVEPPSIAWNDDMPFMLVAVLYTRAPVHLTAPRPASIPAAHRAAYTAVAACTVSVPDLLAGNACLLNALGVRDATGEPVTRGTLRASVYGNWWPAYSRRAGIPDGVTNEHYASVAARTRTATAAYVSQQQRSRPADGVGGVPADIAAQLGTRFVPTMLGHISSDLYTWPGDAARYFSKATFANMLRIALARHSNGARTVASWLTDWCKLRAASAATSAQQVHWVLEPWAEAFTLFMRTHPYKEDEYAVTPAQLAVLNKHGVEGIDGLFAELDVRNRCVKDDVFASVFTVLPGLVAGDCEDLTSSLMRMLVTLRHARDLPTGSTTWADDATVDAVFAAMRDVMRHFTPVCFFAVVNAAAYTNDADPTNWQGHMVAALARNANVGAPYAADSALVLRACGPLYMLESTAGMEPRVTDRDARADDEKDRIEQLLHDVVPAYTITSFLRADRSGSAAFYKHFGYAMCPTRFIEGEHALAYLPCSPHNAGGGGSVLSGVTLEDLENGNVTWVPANAARLRSDNTLNTPQSAAMATLQPTALAPRVVDSSYRLDRPVRLPGVPLASITCAAGDEASHIVATINNSGRGLVAAVVCDATYNESCSMAVVVVCRR